MIPLFYPPKMNVDLVMDEIRSTLESRWIGQGPKVDLFEKMFGEKFGFQLPVMVNSGTAALTLAYVLAGVGPGDEVIVPVLTCTATCHPLKHLGAKIVFVDIKPDTLTMDPADVRKKITSRTKAIVVVHLGGLIADTEKLMLLSVAWKIPIIEDAAQALGAEGVGFGKYTCFSFQAIKTMSTGDGGMLCLKTQEDYARAKLLRWFAIDREAKAKKNWQAWDRRGITTDQEEPGYKFQATDIDASIGLAALTTVDKSIEHRHKLARIYREELAGCDRVTLLAEGDSADWLFMVLVNGNRDEFAQKLLAAGIETNVAHVRNDIFTVFGGRQTDLPGMDSIESRYICLPINDHVSEDDVRYICGVIKG
ncbi:MAG: DegT/DnrJ/EryC1/StrS family aminotransferase [Desulfobacterales bacterium]|nr:DegT/DnrJ/EryC1/StrS family aminotransferase [Desulfobacterales bacterium]